MSGLERAAYDRWICEGHGFAEVMTGLHSGRVRPVALDRAGLAALGFESELPVDWISPEGLLYAGGYGEDRTIYNSPVFATPEAEPRTVHLGVDIFAPSGTPVFVPLDGRVHSFQDNAQSLDYGPTIVLEHSVESRSFYTLYGHLSRASLAGLEKGQVVAKGTQIATLGAPDVNGGWASHLHFQIILDLGGREGDFPGVCKASERDAWLELCPDPAAILGLKSQSISALK